MSSFPPPLSRRRFCTLLGALPGVALPGVALPGVALPGASLAARDTPRGTLPAAVADALRRAGIAESSCSFIVQPLHAPQPTLRLHGATARDPASVLKLVPTFVALNQLGPAFRWHTPVYAIGVLRDGVLSGDLGFVGSGDPHLMAQDLWHLALRLRQLGLRRIDGNVLIDRSAFALGRHDPGAFDGDALAAYNVGPNAFLVNFGAMRLDFQATPSGGVDVLLDPPLAGFAPQRLPRAVPGPCGAWKDALRADFAAPLAPRFDGRFATDCGAQIWNIGAPMPADRYLRALFGALVAEVGIAWSGDVVDGTLPQGATLLTSWASQPLAVIVRDINKYSNNVMAQQLFLTLALQAGQAPADFAKAAAVTRQWLAEHQLSMPGLVLDNGCGLSRRARIRADDVNRLLRAAWMGPVMPEFVASLPLAGEDGTLRRRFFRRPQTGLVRAKTGTLDGVLALAGYVQTGSGAHSTVVALIDDPRAADGWAAIDALLDVVLGLA